MAKKPTTATVEAPAKDESPVAKVIPMLVNYVRVGDPDRALERLEFAAGEAARTVGLAGFGRVGAITLLTLAAEQAGVSRRQAETILGAAFKGIRR